MAVYPASILSWTARVNSQTIYAADPNTLAAEVDAIEQYVGVNPHLESQARTGGTKTFASLSARVSDSMLQNGHPYIEVSNNGNTYKVRHSNSNTHVTRNTYGIVNVNWPGYISAGGIVTIRDSGVWLVSARQTWDYSASGWVQHILYRDTVELGRGYFNYSMFPGGGSNTYGERYIGQFGHTETTFLGRLSAGQTVTVSSGNYTNSNPLSIGNMALALYWIRP